MAEWWFTGIPPAKRREISAQKILELLGEDEKSFSALAEQAEKYGTSRATLSKHLKWFVSAGLVERRVDTSTYPPTVYYRRVKEHPVLVLPFEVWRAWIGEYPPPREASPEENAKWIYAQTLLLLAETVKTLSPPPFFLGNVSDAQIEEWLQKHNIENHFKLLYIHLVEMHLDFCKATMHNKEKLFHVESMLQLYALTLREEALKQYGLSFPEIAEKIRKGEAPKPSRPIRMIFSKKP